jgi:hypothetical protein
MSRPCTICQNVQIDSINRALVNGASCRDIASQYRVGYMSVHRHKEAGHIPASMVKAEEAKEIAKGEDLLEWTKGILGKAVSYMNQAEAAGDLRTACSAIREARGCVELLGKVTGELDSRSQVNLQVNVPSMLNSLEWPTIIRIIERHPEIKAELSQALLEAGK